MKKQRWSIEYQLLRSISNNEELTKESIIKANEINFKEFPEKVMVYDSYGFLKEKKKRNAFRYYINKSKSNDQLYQSHKEALKIKELANKRLGKWMVMLNDFNKYYEENYAKLKARIRKGIPDSLRTQVWQILSGIDESKEENETIYQQYLQLNKEDNENEDDNMIILRDLNRTFPKNIYFMEVLGKGQRELYNVLSAYSKFDEEIGYVQGMSFPVALSLTYMSEESSFWFLHSLMVNFNLRNFYRQGQYQMKKSLFVLTSLIKKHLPKVYKYFLLHKIAAMSYAYEWFFTYFTSVFKFDTVVRIFDTLLLEGFKIIYRISLGILKIHQKSMIKLKRHEDILAMVRNHTPLIPLDTLFNKSFGISLSQKEISQYDEEYENNKDNKDHDIINQIGL